MDLNSLGGDGKEKAEVKKLISLLTHDLKSPIYNVVGFASLLEEILAKETNPDIKFYIDIIRNEAESALKLINNFSDCCSEIQPEFSLDEKAKFNEILSNTKLERQNSIVDA